MSKTFDVGGAVTTGGTTGNIFRLFNTTENPTYHTALSGAQPLWDAFCNALTLTASAACKVEVGMCDAAKANFVPFATTYATYSAAGGIVEEYRQTRPSIPFVTGPTGHVVSPTSVWLAIRITPVADGNVFVAGNIQYGRG